MAIDLGFYFPLGCARLHCMRWLQPLVTCRHGCRFRRTSNLGGGALSFLPERSKTSGEQSVELLEFTNALSENLPEWEKLLRQL